jgi:hypothetical protein
MQDSVVEQSSDKAEAQEVAPPVQAEEVSVAVE